MPKINQFISTANLPVDQSTGNNIASRLQTELAVADAQQSVASSFGQFGRGLARYAKSRDNINKNTAAHDAKWRAREVAARSLDGAMNSKDLLPDGSNLVELYEDEFNPAKEDFLDTLSDSDRSISTPIFESARVNNLGKLLQSQRQRHAEFTLKKSEESSRAFNLSSHQDPSLFGKNALDLSVHFAGLAQDGLITEGEATKRAKLAVRENALSAINGMTQVNRDFDKAIERVTKGDMSQVFSEKDRSKLIETIQNRKMRSIDNDVKEQSREEKASAKLKTEQEEKNFSDFFIKTKKAISSAEREAVETEMERMVSMGRMRSSDQKFLIKMMDEDILDDDQSQAFSFESRLASGEDPKVVLEDVKNSVNGSTLKASTGRQVLNDITTQLSRRASGSKSSVNQRLKLGAKRLDAVFGSKEFLDKLGLNGKEKAVLKNDALIRYNDILRTQVTTDPVDAANQVIQEFGQSSSILPFVPGVDTLKQTSAKGLVGAARTLKERFRKGQVNKKEYNRRLLLLKDRLDAVKLEEEIRQSVKDQVTKRQERKEK